MFVLHAFPWTPNLQITSAIGLHETTLFQRGSPTKVWAAESRTWSPKSKMRLLVAHPFKLRPIRWAPSWRSWLHRHEWSEQFGRPTCNWLHHFPAPGRSWDSAGAGCWNQELRVDFEVKTNAYKTSAARNPVLISDSNLGVNTLDRLGKLASKWITCWWSPFNYIFNQKTISPQDAWGNPVKLP